MVNFKVGDAVERRVDNSAFLRAVGPGPHVVTAVSSGGYWLQINGWVDSSGNGCPWSANNFALVMGQLDDPLPPAPESGVYFNHDNSRKATLRAEEAVVALGVDGAARKVRLTADTALVLAHDLRRMAMEIKRKEKQQ